VPYDVWRKAGLIEATEGNICDYDVIRDRVLEDVETYDVTEIVYDRWGATQLITQLTGEGCKCVPFGQGFQSMAAPTKEWEKLVLGRKIAHNGNEVARWMMGNISVRIDPAGNMKPDKAKSTERIDGIVSAIMALGRAMVTPQRGSIYDEGELKVI
jgi:phage terminase large subunit-like protein